MTMLDQMRRHKGWLKWSLGFVVLAFVIFYIPDFLQQNPTGAISGETVATIEGRDITAGEFRRTYDAQLQAYRNAYGGNVSEQLLKQLGIDQQIIAAARGSSRRRSPRPSGSAFVQATKKCGSASSRRRRSSRTARSSASSVISSCSVRSGPR